MPLCDNAARIAHLSVVGGRQRSIDVLRQRSNNVEDRILSINAVKVQQRKKSFLFSKDLKIKKSEVCGFQKGRKCMRKYRHTVLSAIIFIVAVFCASHTSFMMLPEFFLLFIISQAILLVLQCCDVVHNWGEFREAVGEEACEKVPVMVLYRDKISGIPFDAVLRTIAVMLGINPDRAGTSFVVL